LARERAGGNTGERQQIAELELKLQELRHRKDAPAESNRFCDEMQVTFPGSVSAEARLRQSCHKIVADRGAGLVPAFLDNLPRIMFVFLPILALVPRFHPPAIASAAIWIAVLSYVYLAMRRVYTRRRLKTLVKFGILLFAYTISLGITTAGTVAYSALTLCCGPAPADWTITLGGTHMKRMTLIAGLLLATMSLWAQERTPSAPGAVEYFVGLKDGARVSNPVTLHFGLRGMGVAPAGVKVDNTGHHHLFIDTDLPADMSQPLPAVENKIIHFGKGQTEITLTLPPGKHTLQLVLADAAHVPHQPPVVSKRITITVTK